MPDSHKAYNEEAASLPAWQVRRRMLHGHPRHLYKYLQFDHKDNFSLLKLRTILVDSNLFLTDPAEFNDPFEFKYRIGFGNLEQLRKDLAIAFDKLHGKGTFRPDFKAKQIEALVRRMLENPEEEFKAMFDTSHHGVHCFTPDARAPLMWAHYANSYKGLCLQFKPSNDVSTFIASQPVIYTDKIPTLDLPIGDDADIDAVIRHKGRAWKDERECRIVMLGIKNRLLAFSPEALTGVILGSRFPDDSIPELKRIMNERRDKGHPAVKIFRGQASSTSYRMSIRATDLDAANSGGNSGPSETIDLWEE